jgi:molecular chaperone DnaJ
VGEASWYEVLGTEPSASPDEVRLAYRQEARRHHPDYGGDGQRMQDLNAAWRVLGDPARRLAYDRQLARRDDDPGGPADLGHRDHDVDGIDDYDLDGLDNLDIRDLDDVPYGATRALSGWWAILPPATLLAAVGLLCAAFVFGPGLLALSAGLFILALGLFVLAPLRAMSRKPADD